MRARAAETRESWKRWAVACECYLAVPPWNRQRNGRCYLAMHPTSPIAFFLGRPLSQCLRCLRPALRQAECANGRCSCPKVNGLVVKDLVLSPTRPTTKHFFLFEPPLRARTEERPAHVAQSSHISPSWRSPRIPLCGARSTLLRSAAYSSARHSCPLQLREGIASHASSLS